jgi:ribosomal protein L44E
MKEERKLTEAEKKQYVEACSIGIFGKPIAELSDEEKVTLRVNLLCRCNHDEMTIEDYNLLKVVV